MAEPQVPLRIGDTHLVPDVTGQGVLGVLCEGSVSVGESKATCVYRLATGQHIIVSVPLTEPEVATYRRSPETFFGVVNYVGKELTHPLDAYDFVYGSYSQTPKERLLQFMDGWPDLPALRTLE